MMGLRMNSSCSPCPAAHVEVPVSANYIVRVIFSNLSREVGLVQVADFLLGAVAYRNRNLSGNAAKSRIVERIEKHYEKNLVQTSLLAEDKFDVLIFHPKEVAEQ